jgi:beta-1,4-N-acetylglucosaminyltransferase
MILGHTTEMLEIVKKLNKERYVPRYYVVTENDQNSVDKLLSFEDDKSEYKIYVITRSRKVHQSYFSSIFTTLRSFLDCIPLILHSRPNIILCNGPGICVPVCIVAFFLKVFYIHSSCRIVFIESFCRVKSLSLSGWILLYLTDLFVVQWPDLKKISRKIMYFGRLT